MNAIIKPKIDLASITPIKLERYTVGGHELTRVAGLKKVKIEYLDKVGRRRTKNCLEASIDPANYPKPKHNRQRLVVACGMGTDSIAMLVEMYRRGIRPDLILWADTGSEHEHTYRYINILQAWLAAVDFPPLCIVRRVCPQAGHRSLFEQLWNTMQLPSPAFHRNHSCSIEWKLKPQRNYQSQLDWLGDDHRTAIGFCAGEEDRRGATTNAIAEAVGFSADESDRRSYAADHDDGYETFYPLMTWLMTRKDCVAAIAAAGLPQPGKSACFFCPMSRHCELIEMRSSEPGNLAASLDLEQRYRGSKNFQNKTQGLSKYVGKVMTWKRWIDEPRQQDLDYLQIGLKAEI